MNILTINICSLNVGMSNILGGLSALISSESMDIIFLQEVRLSGPQIEYLLPGYRAAANIEPENPSRPGTAIVWRSDLPVKELLSFSLCRMQLATLGSFKLINVYAPSGSSRKQERASFFSQDLFAALQLSPDRPLILGGDFNCLLKPIDVENVCGFTQKKCQSLDNIVKVFKLIDSFRFCYPTAKEFTFFRPGCAPSRLDRIYLSSCMENAVCNVNHFASLADHCGVNLKISLDLHLQPPSRENTDYSYWKLN